MSIGVIIAAGGQSQRYGERNKLFEPLKGSCVIVEAIKPFLSIEGVTRVAVGVDPSYSDGLLHALDLAGYGDDSRISLCVGGDTRTSTVKNALAALNDDIDVVLVHDGARPYVSQKLILDVLAALDGSDAALPLLQSVDSIARISDGISPVDRREYRLVQTPFAAKRDILEKAYKNTQTAFYDDISLIKTLDNVKINYVDGDRRNKKITYLGDIDDALAGCGYDIHRLEKGDGIRLCGTDIPCQFKTIAHSDGDVPVHALMDAILTAIGERDIGYHFPIDDPRYDGANSLDMLSKTLDLAAKKGYRVGNASVCVIAEKPMLAPYIKRMKETLAAALNVPVYRVGISATTNEQVGDIGNGNAIAAFATVSLLRWPELKT